MCVVIAYCTADELVNE